METASPQALVLRIIAILALAGVTLTGLPFVKDKHLTFRDGAVQGDQITMLAIQQSKSYRAAVDHDRGELGWVAAGAIGLIALVLESMAYQRAIRSRRRASATAAIARFVPVLAVAAVATYLGYPRGGADVEPDLGLMVVAAATAVLVAMTGAEMAACQQGLRGWTAPPPAPDPSA